MGCLFCGHAVKDYKAQTENDFVCSNCVQILLEADREDLKRARKKALFLSNCPVSESDDESLIEWKKEIQEKNIQLGLSFPISDEKVLKKIYLNKAKAIKSFILTKENINDQRKPISKKRGRHSNRKRIVRTIRNKEKRIGRSKVPA